MDEVEREGENIITKEVEASDEVAFYVGKDRVVINDDFSGIDRQAVIDIQAQAMEEDDAVDLVRDIVGLLSEEYGASSVGGSVDYDRWSADKKEH